MSDKRARQALAPQKPASTSEWQSCSIVVGKGEQTPLPRWNTPIVADLCPMSRPEWEDRIAGGAVRQYVRTTRTVCSVVSAAPRTCIPAAIPSRRQSTLTALMTSPGVRTGIPGGYGITASAATSPTASARDTARDGAKYASRGVTACSPGAMASPATRGQEAARCGIAHQGSDATARTRRWIDPGVSPTVTRQTMPARSLISGAI